jgi:hypothetical protein
MVDEIGPAHCAGFPFQVDQGITKFVSHKQPPMPHCTALMTFAAIRQGTPLLHTRTE